MERIHEKFVQKVNNVISFTGKKVLEIGCGSGHYSAKIVRKARSLVAIDPDELAIAKAKKSTALENITFEIGSATDLKFDDNTFDIVIFTLSFHHVPILHMSTAMGEAYRVVKSDGYIIFLEPAVNGSFFEAEVLFDAGDGDEREVKEYARRAISRCPLLKVVVELGDITTFVFESVDDFTRSLQPKKNVETLPEFLKTHSMQLTATRRIYICSPNF